MTSALCMFFYVNGLPVMVGDVVLIAFTDEAIVTDIYKKNTQDARDYGCYETGGFMLSFENGDCQLWTSTDEDIELLKRKEI